MNERSIFLEALDKEGAERAAYLDAACAGNNELRLQVEALLQEHAGAGSFLEGRAVDQVTVDAATLQAEPDARVSPRHRPGDPFAASKPKLLGQCLSSSTSRVQRARCGRQDSQWPGRTGRRY